MNQEKIGKFIFELRKEKNMTQQELADKLNVSDRTISKWERGRGLPDYSLLIPLCENLDISLNEFFSGEKIINENNDKKFNENIINILNDWKKNVKKIKINFTIVICLIILLFTSVFVVYQIDMNRLYNNESPIFSNWGHEYNPYSIEGIIETYLKRSYKKANKVIIKDINFYEEENDKVIYYVKYDIKVTNKLVQNEYFAGNGNIDGNWLKDCSRFIILKKENNMYKVIDMATGL